MVTISLGFLKELYKVRQIPRFLFFSGVLYLKLVEHKIIIRLALFFNVLLHFLAKKDPSNYIKST